MREQLTTWSLDTARQAMETENCIIKRRNKTTIYYTLVVKELSGKRHIIYIILSSLNIQNFV